MDFFIFLIDEVGFWAIIIVCMFLCIQLGLWINRDTVNDVIKTRKSEVELRKNQDSLARTLWKKVIEEILPLTHTLLEKINEYEDQITKLILSGERKNRIIRQQAEEIKRLRMRR